MVARMTRRQIILALLAGLAIVLVAYFSQGRTVNPNLTLSSPASHPKSPRPNQGRSAQRKLAQIDSDEDGLPDAAELQTFRDRENFRRWMTSIAETQFYNLSTSWNVDQQDCSGLVRFAWREALRPHDRSWFQRMGPGYELVAPDVRSLSLEQGPLGEKLFRTDWGVYRDGDLNSGKFSEFADARTLKAFNSRFVSRNRQEAQAGDLLFFHQPWTQKFPFHVMIFLGRARIADDGNNDWVVYHTGSTPTVPGTVKKVRLAVLDQHPNKRWRPVESNPNFVGFYRLKILE